MTPDDDSHRDTRKLRGLQIILAFALGLLASGTSVAYVIFLQPKLGWVVVGAMIAMEFLVMAVVYFILVSQMRKRR